MLLNWLYCLYGSLQCQGYQQFSFHHCDLSPLSKKLRKIASCFHSIFWAFFLSKTETLAFYYIQFSRIPLLLIHPTYQCANINKPNYLYTDCYHYPVVYLITCMMLALRPRACVLLITGWWDRWPAGQLIKMLGKG